MEEATFKHIPFIHLFIHPFKQSRLYSWREQEIEEVEEYLKNNKIDIAIISVQKEIAEKTAKKVVDLGVKAIWNFAPTDLYFGDSAVCENINMSESLMRLIYKRKGADKELQ